MLLNPAVNAYDEFAVVHGAPDNLCSVSTVHTCLLVLYPCIVCFQLHVCFCLRYFFFGYILLRFLGMAGCFA